MLVYITVTHILMLNLLIAMFSYTFSQVQSNNAQNQVWCYHQYALWKEYDKKPSLLPPFIIISHIYRLVTHCMKNSSDKNRFNLTLNKSQQKLLIEFEHVNASKYYKKTKTAERT